MSQNRSPAGDSEFFKREILTQMLMFDCCNVD